MKNDFKKIIYGTRIGLGVVVALMAQQAIGPGGPVVNNGGTISSVINNVTTISNLNQLTVNNVTVTNNITVSGKATFNQVLVTNGLFWGTNLFVGPSNSIDLNKSMQTYVTYTPCSFTGIVNNLNYAGSPIGIGISNASTTNITVYYPYFRSADGSRSATITNATYGRFWVLYDPSLNATDIVARPTFY